MEKQVIDFKNPSKEVIFELCLVEPKMVSAKYKEPSINVDRETHRDLLAKYELQSFSDMLIKFQKKWFAQKESMFKFKKTLDGSDNQTLEHRLKIAKLYKMFLSQEFSNKSNLSISFIDLIDKITIDEKNLLTQFQELIKKEFFRLNLNETEYTRDEAIEEIKAVEDVDWFVECGGSFVDDEFIKNYLASEELIEEYRSFHYKTREVTLDLVNDVINEYEIFFNAKKSKAGAKIKNMNIGELARRLSYLPRVELFLNQNKISSITNFPLSNKTCRFIYEYFDFWDLLYDHVKFDKSEQVKRANYIKSLIRNNSNYSKMEIINTIKNYTIIDQSLETRIDLFKKVKEGLSSPEEFYQKISGE